jgi:hypothetical protein
VERLSIVNDVSGHGAAPAGKCGGR